MKGVNKFIMSHKVLHHAKLAACVISVIMDAPAVAYAMVSS